MNIVRLNRLIILFVTVFLSVGHSYIESFLGISALKKLKNINLSRAQKQSSWYSNKRIMYTVLTTATILGISYGSYWLYNNYRHKKKNAKNTVPTVKSQTNLPAATVTTNGSKESLRADYNTFWDWKSVCDKLSRVTDTALTAEQFLAEIKYFNESEKQRLLAQKKNWVEPAPSEEFFMEADFNNGLPSDLQALAMYGQFFLQKLEIPVGGEIAFHGDIHGDIHSLNGFIEFLSNNNYLDKSDPFKIVNPNFYMVFLGDYVDRGDWGAEVMYTILRLKKANPDRVFMVRGNHEDIGINLHSGAGGFVEELKRKFKEGAQILIEKIQKFYAYLPVALYLVSGAQERNALLCCHGGPEFGCERGKALLEKPEPISYSLLGKINRQSCLEKLDEDIKAQIEQCMDSANKKTHLCDFIPQMPTKPSFIGFMWNDFQVAADAKTSFDENRGFKLGKTLLKILLGRDKTATCTVRGVFRAHQHGDPEMMDRIYNTDKKGPDFDAGVGKLWVAEAAPEPEKLWNNIVCTFSVCPGAPYVHRGKRLEYEAFGILKTAPVYNDWRLTVHRIPVVYT